MLPHSRIDLLVCKEPRPLRIQGLEVDQGDDIYSHAAAQNPGLIPTSILNSKVVYQESYLNLTDITVVFEEAFDKWLDKDVLDPLQSHKIRRSKLAVILHSLPNLSKPVLDFMIEQVEETADWLFVTDVKESNEYYHSFSSIFDAMVKSVDGGGRRRRDRRSKIFP